MSRRLVRRIGDRIGRTKKLISDAEIKSHSSCYPPCVLSECVYEYGAHRSFPFTKRFGVGGVPERHPSVPGVHVGPNGWELILAEERIDRRIMYEIDATAKLDLVALKNLCQR